MFDLGGKALEAEKRCWTTPVGLSEPPGRWGECFRGALQVIVIVSQWQTDKGLRNEVEAVQVHGRVRCRWQLASQEADQFGSNKRRRFTLRKMAYAF